MEQWKIRQTVDLAASGSGPQAWTEALMTDGDKHAHTWIITVLNGGKPAELSGVTAVCYFNRADHATVAVPATISENLVSVTMTEECYAIEGPLVGIFRMMTNDAMTLTLSVLRFNVGKGPNSAIVDPGGVVPNLETLLAQVARIEAVTQACVNATDDASAAADRANAAANRIDWNIIFTDDGEGNVTVSGADIIDDGEGNVIIAPFAIT